MLVCFCSVALAASLLVKDGSRGHAVKHVQTLLIEQGYLSTEPVVRVRRDGDE